MMPICQTNTWTRARLVYIALVVLTLHAMI